MNTKKTIRKILIIGVWLAIGSGMLMLLIAAIGKQKKDTCKDFEVTVKGATAGELFLDEKDIVKLVKAATKGKIKGQPKSDFQLYKIENLLESNGWVKDAQLYFDNNDVLHIKVEERTPIARIFTGAGRSFYIDETGTMMQLSSKVSARLPVFTGFPEKKKLAKSDSLLLNDIMVTATVINANPFWTSQVSQIDITPASPNKWEMDMIPLIGNHTVKLGNGKNIEEKFNRLFIFYREVLSKSGFDKYKTVDVRFAGQVVAAKSENPKVDQAQLRKSVETLLRQIKEAEAASEAEARTVQVTTAPASTPKPATTTTPPKAVMPKPRG